MWRVGRASDQESLRLMLAYLQISDPVLRRQVIRLAEKFAGVDQPMLIPDLVQDNVRQHEDDPEGGGEDGVPKLRPSR